MEEEEEEEENGDNNQTTRGFRGDCGHWGEEEARAAGSRSPCGWYLSDPF